MQILQNKTDLKIILIYNTERNAKMQACLSKFWVCSKSSDTLGYLESWNKYFLKYTVNSTGGNDR